MGVIVEFVKEKNTASKFGGGVNVVKDQGGGRGVRAGKVRLSPQGGMRKGGGGTS